MGREEEGGIGITHVNPWLSHVNVWQKPLQYCKVISLQLIKINLKKKFLRDLLMFFTHKIQYFVFSSQNKLCGFSSIESPETCRGNVDSWTP